jgi:hypothetical protein
MSALRQVDRFSQIGRRPNYGATFAMQVKITAHFCFDSNAQRFSLAHAAREAGDTQTADISPFDKLRGLST